MAVIISPLMPPLMEEEFVTNFDRKNSDTMFIGKSAELVVASYLLKNKINFAEPQVDQGNDFWVEEGGIKKAQVKKVVYKFKKDLGYFRRHGVIVRRHTFDFRFQSCGASREGFHAEYGPNNIDVFYHVLSTSLRELIFKIPSNFIPLTEKGTFIQSKSPVLERPFKQKKKPSFDLRGTLISAKYDAKLVQANHDFFFPHKQQTVMDFFS